MRKPAKAPAPVAIAYDSPRLTAAHPHSSIARALPSRTSGSPPAPLTCALDRVELLFGGSVSHFNSIHNFLADPATTAVLTSRVEQLAASLRAIEGGQYAVDSTGFSTAVYDRCLSQKHGKLCSQKLARAKLGQLSADDEAAIRALRDDDALITLTIGLGIGS